MTSAEVDTYISHYDGEVKARLLSMRKLVTELVPEAEESLSYGLVGYKLNGKPLVYFGGFPNHIGFYATPNGHAAFKEEFAKYKQGKGSVQLPHAEPIPIELVKKVVTYRRDLIGG